MCLENAHKKRIPWVRGLNSLSGLEWELGLIQAEDSQYLSWVLHTENELREAVASSRGRQLLREGFVTSSVLGAGT